MKVYSPFGLIAEIEKLEKLIINAISITCSETQSIFNIKNLDSIFILEIMDIDNLNSLLISTFNEKSNFNFIELIRTSCMDANAINPLNLRMTLPVDNSYGFDYEGSYRCLKMVFNTLFEIIKRFSKNDITVRFDTKNKIKIILIEFQSDCQIF